MKIDFTNEMIFSFPGPNICFLGNEIDFRKLAESILELTDNDKPGSLELLSLGFVESAGEKRKIIFSSKVEAKQLAVFNESGDVIFELDPKVWERLFRYFVLMSWYKRTYYLNAYEDCLYDLGLVQDVNFICSSGF